MAVQKSKGKLFIQLLTLKYTPIDYSSAFAFQRCFIQLNCSLIFRNIKLYFILKNTRIKENYFCSLRYAFCIYYIFPCSLYVKIHSLKYFLFNLSLHGSSFEALLDFTRRFIIDRFYVIIFILPHCMILFWIILDKFNLNFPT